LGYLYRVDIENSLALTKNTNLANSKEISEDLAFLSTNAYQFDSDDDSNGHNPFVPYRESGSAPEKKAEPFVTLDVGTTDTTTHSKSASGIKPSRSSLRVSKSKNNDSLQLPIVLSGGVLASRPDPSISSIPPPPKITGSKVLARQNSGTFGPIADEIETLPGVPPNNNRAKPIPKPASRGDSKVQRNRRSGKKNGGFGGGGKGSGNATVKILSQQVSDIQDKLSAERDLVKELKEDVKHAMEDKVTEKELSRDRALNSQLADTFTKDPVIFHEPLLNLSGRARAVTNYLKTFRFTSWIPFGHMALDICNELFEVLECVYL